MSFRKDMIPVHATYTTNVSRKPWTWTKALYLFVRYVVLIRFVSGSTFPNLISTTIRYFAVAVQM